MPELAFPSPKSPSDICQWNGRTFLLDGRETPVLAYSVSTSGWTDELTHFHEEVAGDNHYIDVASRKHALAALKRGLKRAGTLGEEAVVIDIGCSSGSMLGDLRQALPKAMLIGADYISGPLLGLASKFPGVPFLQFDLVNCPLFSNSMDAVILLNVLEHIEDDVSAMKQTFRITKPGGVVVVEVPAGPHLYDVYDKQLMHFRRYKLNSLCEKLREAGFVLEERSHLGAFLYPMFAMVKKRNQKRMGDSEAEQKQIVAKSISQADSYPLMGTIMKLEEALRPLIYYPIGIRCLVSCRKP